jgi:hypothetical protein
MYLLFIILISIISIYLLFVIVLNLTLLIQMKNLKESPVKFLYEDGNYYWFLIKEQITGSYKIYVYNKNPYSIGWNLLIRGIDREIGSDSMLEYNEKLIERPIHNIINNYKRKNKSNLEKFKGYIGDVPKILIREDKFKKLGL